MREVSGRAPRTNVLEGLPCVLHLLEHPEDKSLHTQLVENVRENVSGQLSEMLVVQGLVV